MTKKELLRVLNTQKETTKKTTRKDFIDLVANMVEYHIKDNAVLSGINTTRNEIGVNLGEVMEVVLKSIFRNKTEKSDSNKHFDAQIKGEKVEIKWTTSDAYAHPINASEKVDYYLIVAYSKRDGGNVFKVPYENLNEIITNNQNRVMTNQKVKFLDSRLTKKVFAF